MEPGNVAATVGVGWNRSAVDQEEEIETVTNHLTNLPESVPSSICTHIYSALICFSMVSTPK